MCLIQGGINFVTNIVIQLSSDRPGISILGVANIIHFRTTKYLLSYSEIQGFSVSSFRHCDVGGVTRAPCILIHNIKESGSVREEVYRRAIKDLDAMLQVQERRAVRCTGPTTNDAGIEDVREISTHPSPS